MPEPQASRGGAPAGAVAGALIGAAAGLLAGVLGSFLQAWVPSSLPAGLALALLALVVALVLGSRAGAAVGATATSAGWALAVLLLLWPRREGDVVLAATAEAYTYLFCGFLLCAVGLVAARRRDSRTAPAPPMQDG